MTDSAWYGSGQYGPGSGAIAFGYSRCSGNENSLFDCGREPFSVAGSGYCASHSHDIGIKCHGK